MTAQTDSSIHQIHFAAALVMIASLPLSDAEKAEAVRRLLVGRSFGGTLLTTGLGDVLLMQKSISAGEW